MTESNGLSIKFEAKDFIIMSIIKDYPDAVEKEDELRKVLDGYSKEDILRMVDAVYKFGAKTIYEKL